MANPKYKTFKLPGHVDKDLYVQVVKTSREKGKTEKSVLLHINVEQMSGMSFKNKEAISAVSIYMEFEKFEALFKKMKKF